MGEREEGWYVMLKMNCAVTLEMVDANGHHKT